MLIELDGTENKSNLGANALLAVSMANARRGRVVQGCRFTDISAA